MVALQSSGSFGFSRSQNRTSTSVAAYRQIIAVTTQNGRATMATETNLQWLPIFVHIVPGQLPIRSTLRHFSRVVETASAMHATLQDALDQLFGVWTRIDPRSSTDQLRDKGRRLGAWNGRSSGSLSQSWV